jgi:MYXO-CTERM domain-containing protein
MGLAGVMVFAGVEEASACSSSRFYVNRAAVEPGDGMTGVPTNAEILVEYWAGLGSDGGPPTPDLVVQRAGGAAAVACDVETIELRRSERYLVVARPREPLLAGTGYELLDRVGAEGGTGYRIDHAVFATFVTGGGPDVTPPSFGGIRRADVSRTLEVCDHPACCGPYSSVSFNLSWDLATDDHPAGWVRYHIYRDAELVARVPNMAASGEFLCSGRMMFGTWRDFEGGSGRYTVQAVDLAGNVDGNAEVLDVDVPCPPRPSVDGGPAPDVDAGPGEIDAEVPVDAGAEGPPVPRAGGGGCSVGAGPAGRLAVPMLLALAALVRRRRR